MTFRAEFHFDMRPEWENAVKEGLKSLDIRDNIAPFADVKKGDIVRYRSSRVRVSRINIYQGVLDAVAYEDFKKIAPDAGTRDEALDKILDELHHLKPPHGVLVFEIERMDD